MNKEIKYLAGKASEMMRNDKPRINLFKKIDRMIELDWTLPQQMQELKWMRKVISTDLLSAVTVGRRTLSTIRPKVFIKPLNDNIVTKKMANQNEQNLLLQLKAANRRGEFDIIGDIVESALRYGMTAAMTVPVEWQWGGTPSNWVRDPKGYIILPENPMDVYPRFTPFGLESVLHVKAMRAWDAVRFYGKAANELAEKIEGEQAELNVIIYDYWDHDKRVTMCGEATEYVNIPDTLKPEYIFNDEDMELPFLPWTIKKTGTSLARSMEHRIRPTFAGIAHADIWELQNISKTLAFSEALGYAAAPRGKVTSYSDETLVEMIDYGDINKPIRLKPGEDYKPLAPPEIDQNLLHILDRTTVEIDRITGMKNLASLDPPSGTAFATVNEIIKAASSALDPAKELAENTIAGVFEDMMQWSSYRKEDIVAIGDGKKTEAGRTYRLRHEHIQPDAIDIEVELTAHVPTDKLQQINAAILMNKELQMPKSKVYRELDEENPEELIADWNQEQLNDAMVQNVLKQIMAQGDMQIQQQMQGGMNPESESQARMANGGMPPTRTGAPRREAQSLAARGPGFNPAAGGISPNAVNPRGFTKEGMTGVDRRGNAI